MLQVLCEERVDDESVHEYFNELYRVVCVGERPESHEGPGGPVRTTYVVDWEQLVHLLEAYTLFGEDIVEVQAMEPDEARLFRSHLGGALSVARA